MDAEKTFEVENLGEFPLGETDAERNIKDSERIYMAVASGGLTPNGFYGQLFIGDIPVELPRIPKGKGFCLKLQVKGVEFFKCSGGGVWLDFPEGVPQGWGLDGVVNYGGG